MKIGDTTITDPSEYEINPTNPTTEITLMSGDRRFHEKTSNNNIYFHWNYLPSSELETIKGCTGSFTVTLDGDSYTVASGSLQTRRVKGTVEAYEVDWEVKET